MYGIIKLPCTNVVISLQPNYSIITTIFNVTAGYQPQPATCVLRDNYVTGDTLCRWI